MQFSPPPPAPPLPLTSTVVINNWKQVVRLWQSQMNAFAKIVKNIIKYANKMKVFKAITSLESIIDKIDKIMTYLVILLKRSL